MTWNEKPAAIPEGFAWRDACAVDAMMLGDKCRSRDGHRYQLYARFYPCEPTLVFVPLAGGDVIKLPLSQAAADMQPDESRVVGHGYLVVLPEGSRP